MAAQIMTRVEVPADWPAIHALHREAFPTAAEAELVDRLRKDSDAVFSLVAAQNQQVVGHALFSKMRAPVSTLGLGPVAVRKQWQRQGIAALMIRTGIQSAKETGWKAVFVLGGEYYRRFGFDPAFTATLRSPYAGPHLMGLALDPGWRPLRESALEYAPAFAMLG
jgi:putative acetyltransferase